MTAVKTTLNDAVSVNAEVAGDFRDRKSMTSLKVLKEIETDLESNASSSEDMEYYSPRSVVVKVKKWPVPTKEVNVSRARIHDPILRIRSEDRQIGEDIGEGFVTKSGNDRVNVRLFSRPISPLGGKKAAIGVEH